jgi:preprotein translocase subunit YajC
VTARRHPKGFRMNANTAQLLFFGVIIVVIIALMFRNGRKRQRDAQSMAQGLKPGAEIMTSSGIFGTIVSFDEAENKVVLETSPGTHLTVHRQAIGRVVTPVAEDGTQLNGEPVVLDDAGTDPEYGERVERVEPIEPTTDDATRRTGGPTSKGAGE